MSLHVECIGSGAPLVLLHGWGMHGGVWSDVAVKLAQNFCVHSIDLPGYGHSKNVEWIDVVERMSAQFSEPVSVCGWSLGGQIAAQWALREPAKVQRLILVASTPCFVQRQNWLTGMAADVFEKFAVELEQNHAATLRRFIALQLRGSENERELLVQLRERLFSRGEPDIIALRAGLQVLNELDLRAELAYIAQPTLVVAGERDKLTPPQASHYLAETLPAAQLLEIPGAAHAPFLSHPDIFVGAVNDFLKKSRAGNADQG
ncbi:MAG: pimeloyl-ACP methyl ester esterase BioH [Gallionellaceae bacterium]|jgi:pimeloyl-[acyl-carrier protein] methyl ester esterase